MDEFDDLVLREFLKNYKYYFDEIAKKYSHTRISKKANENIEKTHKLIMTDL